MKKIMFVVALMAVGFYSANAQWGHRNERHDDSRYDSRRRSNGRWDDNRYDRNDNLGDRIDDFQREARRRIGWGIERGMISSREARSLMRDVERIERKEQIFWRDGRLNDRERRDLMGDLRDLNRAIAHETRDNERSTYDDYGRSNDPRLSGRNRGW